MALGSKVDDDVGLGDEAVDELPIGDIANQFPESSGLDVNTLIASGLVLFVLTLAVNMFARWIISRRSEFSGAN